MGYAQVPASSGITERILDLWLGKLDFSLAFLFTNSLAIDRTIEKKLRLKDLKMIIKLPFSMVVRIQFTDNVLKVFFLSLLNLLG